MRAVCIRSEISRVERMAEWNGKYRDELRSFLKGEYWFAAQAAKRITGSPDLYGGQYRGYNSSINFLTCHDGFTLYDLYSYNEKHNEENGWNNTDGADDNRSWNCGYEGKTDNPGIEALRKRMIKNACAVLLCSRGTPMFLAGDDFAIRSLATTTPTARTMKFPGWTGRCWKKIEKFTNFSVI